MGGRVRAGEVCAERASQRECPCCFRQHRQVLEPAASIRTGVCYSGIMWMLCTSFHWRVRVLISYFNEILLRVTLVTMDATVWPADIKYVTNCVEALCQILNTNLHGLGHLQMPVVQAQTSVNAQLKHKRLFEDNLLKRDLDLSHCVTMAFQKEVEHRQDKRNSTQHAYAVHSGHMKFQQSIWATSEAVTRGFIDNLPLVKVGEMLGYDADNRPGAAARAEQFLGRNEYLLFFMFCCVCDQVGAGGSHQSSRATSCVP